MAFQERHLQYHSMSTGSIMQLGANPGLICKASRKALNNLCLSFLIGKMVLITVPTSWELLHTQLNTMPDTEHTMVNSHHSGAGDGSNSEE